MSSDLAAWQKTTPSPAPTSGDMIAWAKPRSRSKVGAGRDLAQWFALGAIPQFPIFSRGQPVNDSGGFGFTNAAANAVDGDYGSFWRSVNSPNAGTPQWIVIDLRAVAAADKTNAWFVFKNGTMPSYQPAAILGAGASSAFASLPRNFMLQGHASSGAQPAINDAGWTTLQTFTDNYMSQIAATGLNLSAYNWFRLYCTATSGVTGSTDDVLGQIDLRNAAAGGDDSIVAYGDSITMEAFNGRAPGNGAWNGGPLENLLEALTTRPTPVILDFGVGGWRAQDGDSNKALFLSQAPCKYVLLNYGSNDANNANIDLATVGGVASDYAQAYKTSMQNIINYAVGLGKLVIIPHMPWGSVNTWMPSNTAILNQIIDQLVTANPGAVYPGPDFFTFFQTNPGLLRDGLHPTYDTAQGQLNGLTGYENYLRMWRDTLNALLYT